MKETNFSEKESLELIAQMIQQTKDNMKVGNGNVLLYYGYPAILIALVVYLLVLKTGNSLWATGWFLMFVPGILLKLKNSRHKPSVITYMDKAVDNTWTVVGSLFALSVVAILLTGVWIGVINFGLMLPLSLLYAGIGISITGVITKFQWLIYSPLPAFVLAIYMLAALVTEGKIAVTWHLWFGFSFLIMMVIPGHILNNQHKSVR